MKLLKTAILVLWYIFNAVSANNEVCNSPEVEFNGLVHPLGTIHVLCTSAHYRAFWTHHFLLHF